MFGFGNDKTKIIDELIQILKTHNRDIYKFKRQNDKAISKLKKENQEIKKKLEEMKCKLKKITN